METQFPDNQLPLEQDRKARLRLFGIISRPAMSFPAVPGEKVWMILAYGPEEAIERVKMDAKAINPIAQAIVYTGDFCWMDELLQKVKSGETGTATIQRSTIVLQTAPMGIDGFRDSLMMVKDEYVKSEEDKKTLDRIIKSLREKK